MDPTARFAVEVRREDPRLDVIATSIAACDHPVEHEDVTARLDALAATAGSDATTLCQRLFGEDCALRGAVEDYGSPQNSFIDRVLSRGRGIPITLSVIAIEVGRRAGIGLVGVGMPGHFLVREATDAQAFFDPFFGGRALTPAECEQRFTQVQGPFARFHPSMLEPTPPISIAERMLANLTRAYLDRSETASLLWVLRLRSLLPGAPAAVVRQFAGVAANAGRWWEAAEAFERLADLQPDRADDHRSAAARLRASAN